MEGEVPDTICSRLPPTTPWPRGSYSLTPRTHTLISGTLRTLHLDPLKPPPYLVTGTLHTDPWISDLGIQEILQASAGGRAGELRAMPSFSAEAHLPLSSWLLSRSTRSPDITHSWSETSWYKTETLGTILGIALHTHHSHRNVCLPLQWQTADCG